MTEFVDYLRENETRTDFLNRCTNLSKFDCSEGEMLWLMMGPRTLPLVKVVPMSVLLLVIFATGMAGNVAVCVVIVRHPAMHTATNYYLFSLALSDLLLLLFGEMLWLMMGPRTLPLVKVVPMSVLLLVIFATGMAGNVAVCVVIVRHPAMHTATNYYLFSLALSDLLLLIFGLPNDLSVYWHQYPYSLGIGFCKLRALISEAASYVSVLTIVAFSLERYLAICHPLHLYAMAGLQRALKIVTALWLISLLAASPFAIYTTVNYHDYPPGSGNASLESAFCAMLEQPSWYLCELSSLLFFILPGFIILCLYVRMGLRIRYVLGTTYIQKLGSPGTLNGVNGSVHGEARQAQSKKAIIRMLAAVVVAFFVCWAPFHFQRLFFIYGTSSPHYNTINEYLYYVAGAFYYISATVNPILYNVMSHRYRIAFSETLCCGGMQRTKSPYREHSSVRDTVVNHTSDGAHLVRVRSEIQDRRNRLDRRSRRCSYYGTETTSLCRDKWRQETPKKMNMLLMKEKNCISTTLCNNNDANQLICNNFNIDNGEIT